MSGTIKQFVDFSNNTITDTGENVADSIQPIANGETVNADVLGRPNEGLRQRTEALRDTLSDVLYLRDADRKVLVVMPAGTGVVWPGVSTGIPVLTGTLWVIPMLTPGYGQAPPIPPVASVYGTLHLKRVTDSLDSILVTSMRRNYAAGDQISAEVSAGAAFACTLEANDSYERTIKIVAVTGVTTLTDVINALNALLPTAPDNTQLVTATIEGGASGADLFLTTQAKQFVSGNVDGEGHSLSAANLASFFSSDPTSVLAEGDTLCIQYAMVTEVGGTGGRRQSIPENTNTALSAGALFNSRLHPEKLANAIPLFKVIDNQLVTTDGHLLQSGNVIGSSFGAAGAMPLDFVDGSHVGCPAAANWADGTMNPTRTMTDQVQKIIDVLAASGGSAKAGSAAVGTDLIAGTVLAQITALATGWAKLDRFNEFTANQTFSGVTTEVGGDAILAQRVSVNYEASAPAASPLVQCKGPGNADYMFMVDWLGFPAGQFSTWEEDWRWPYANSAENGWTMTGLTPSIAAPSATALTTRSVYVAAASGATPVSSAIPEYIAQLGDDYMFSMEWDIQTGANWAGGEAGDYMHVGVQTSGGGGAYFALAYSEGANIKATLVGTTTSGPTDTLVAGANSTVYRMRMDIIGKNLIGGATGFTVRWWLNGTVVKVLTNDVRWTGIQDVRPYFYTNSAGGGGLEVGVYVGRVRCQWNHRKTPDYSW